MHTFETLRAYCLAKTATVEEFPFGEDSVFKVMGKMYALVTHPSHTPPRITLKADPDWTQLLRATYPAVTPGYYMNKQHWNTVIIDGTIPDDEIIEMIDHSYNLVVKGLKKAEREALANIGKEA